MEYFLGGVLFALFIAAQALALIAMRPVSMPKSRQFEPKPDGHLAAGIRRSIRVGTEGGLSARGRRLLQP